MCPLTACKISVSIFFNRISELMLPTLIRRYDKIISFQFIKHFLDNKMYIFEEYGELIESGLVFVCICGGVGGGGRGGGGCGGVR